MKIKSCPFCGTYVYHKIDGIQAYTTKITIDWIIECINCGCFKKERGNYYIATHDNKVLLEPYGNEDEALKVLIDKWNTRMDGGEEDKEQQDKEGGV